ncbi:MAG: hypothetical protein KDC88_16575 [Ignavibacteriae bacterium]|nr:hypothetical protein [Ignavibacteriota bacterium]
MKNLNIIIFITILMIVSLNNQKKNTKPLNMSNEIQNVQSSSQLGLSIENLLSERVLTTSVIFGEILILLLVLFYWRKTHQDSKRNTKVDYRKNIKALRSEKIKPIFNKNISRKRLLLKTNIGFKSLNGKSITNKAKKLSIAKGELFLAARIQQLQSQVK